MAALFEPYSLWLAEWESPALAAVPLVAVSKTRVVYASTSAKALCVKANSSLASALAKAPELEVVERGAVLAGEGLHPHIDPSLSGGDGTTSLRPEGERLIVQRHWEEAYEVSIDGGDGGHGGGDELLLSDVFEGPGDDPLARPADWIR